MRRTTGARSLLIAVTIATVATVCAEAEDGTVRYRSRIDWEAGTIATSARVDLHAYDGPLPIIRRRATLDAGRALAGHLLATLENTPIDAGFALGRIVRSDSLLLSRFTEFARTGHIERSYVEEDMSALHVHYHHRIFPELASLFIAHTRAYEHEPYLGFAPSTAFTGLVVYAKGRLPVHGEPGTTRRLQPAIAPRIYTESMDLLYEVGMVEPAAAPEGIVRYAAETQLQDHRDRVGELPLITSAREVFGVNRTDLVVPDEVYGRLLAEPENRALLRKGRVLVICDLPGDDETVELP